jgi:hypothetical protein
VRNVFLIGKSFALREHMQTVSLRNGESSDTLRCYLLTSDKLPNRWPPLWTWVAGTGNRRLDSESAILKNVAVSEFEGVSGCHLLVEHEASYFIGTLLFDDVSLCGRVCEVLLDHCGESIQSIGELAIRHTVETISSETLLAARSAA